MSASTFYTGQDPNFTPVDTAIFDDTVLAGGFLLRRSTDGGRTWQEVLPRRLNLDQGIRVLTTAPGGLAFAGTFQRLLRSVDGGASWSEVLKGLAEGGN